MKAKVYLETSFISYLTARLSTDLQKLQRQLSSRDWWEKRRFDFELFISQTVYAECSEGDLQAARDRQAILQQTTLLPTTGQVLELARRLVEPGPFPRKADDDAVHLAAATAYGCEYLLTWNFKHLNNARIKREAYRIIEAWDLTPRKDDIMEEIHAMREAHAARFDYDLDRIFEDLKKSEAGNPLPRANFPPLEPKPRKRD